MIAWKESAREEVREIYEYLFDQSIAVADEWSDELEKEIKPDNTISGDGAYRARLFYFIYSRSFCG